MKTNVMFRIDVGGVYALMPYDIATMEGDITAYQHIGQHQAADYDVCIRTSKPATPEEYADLKHELEGIGYNLRIIKKRNYDKYLAELIRVRERE